MKRDILFLNCPEIQCPLVLLYVFREMGGYFTRHNYDVRVINSLHELHNNAVVFMGDTIKCADPVKLLHERAPLAIYIGWYWIHHNTSPLKYFIHIYENVLNKSYNPSRFNPYMSVKNSTPLLLRADEDPELIGTYKRDIKYDYCYMGYRYCPHLVPTKYKGIYHGVNNHTKFIDYESRRDIYLSSFVALGFQSDENVRQEHVSQRIFEGLTYGCIVVSNSQAACKQTNGIVLFVSTRKDIEDIITYYKNNPEEHKKKQDDGYEFAKKYGTNTLTVELLRNKILANYDISI